MSRDYPFYDYNWHQKPHKPRKPKSIPHHHTQNQYQSQNQNQYQVTKSTTTTTTTTARLPHDISRRRKRRDPKSSRDIGKYLDAVQAQRWLLQEKNKQKRREEVSGDGSVRDAMRVMMGSGNLCIDDSDSDSDFDDYDDGLLALGEGEGEGAVMLYTDDDDDAQLPAFEKEEAAAAPAAEEDEAAEVEEVAAEQLSSDLRTSLDDKTFIAQSLQETAGNNEDDILVPSQQLLQMGTVELEYRPKPPIAFGTGGQS